MTEVKRLTKAQREFFTEFAKNSVGNALFPILHAQGFEFTPELAKKLIDMQELTEFTELVGQAFLQRVDFNAIKRVDKIMKSDEFQDVIVASQQVNDVVNDQLIDILTKLIPTDESFGKEVEDALAADLAS
jgi:hemerythrin superfamily protein